MNKLIGLTGLAQSGKSTVATYLKETHNFYEDSFAVPIRSMVCGLLGISLAELEELKESIIEGFEKTPREMMQTLGTEWGRQMIQDDLWITALKYRLPAPTTAKKIVVSDIRFENEAALIRSLGGTIWHVKRQGQAMINASKHVSEVGIELLPSDRIVTNIGSIKYLHEITQTLLEEQT